MTLKLLATIWFSFSLYCLYAQKVIISGEEGNQPLKWSDFTGTPDNSDPYFAHTGWTTRYGYSGVHLNGDVAVLENFQFTLQLDPQTSWVKSGKQSDDLLKHEQGHFNIALLHMRDVLQQVAKARFSRTNYKEEFRKLMQEIAQKYKDMNVQYDRETNHSVAKEEQQRWNAWFEKEVKK